MKRFLQILTVSLLCQGAGVVQAAAPTGVAATANSTTQITVTWKDNSANETGFKIERRKSGSPDFAPVYTAAANAATYQDTALIPGTKYYYRVSALSPEGPAVSDVAEVTTIPLPPVAPSKLIATAVSGSRVNLSWTSNGSTHRGYKFERKAGGGAFIEVKKLNAEATTYDDFGLKDSSQYVYRIRSTNAAGDSPYSNEAMVTTLNDDAFHKNPGNLWIGTYQKKVGTVLYTWIPTREATIDVSANGKIRLICPETKPALEGKNTCERFVYDENYRELDAATLKELFTNGLSLPDGQYAFHIRYAKAPKGDYAHVDANIWALFHEPGKYQSNCAESEMVSFSIEGASKPAPGEIIIPAEERRVSYVASYMYLNHNLVLPPNKDFGVSRYAVDLTGKIDELGSLDHLFAKKVTHMNDTYYDIVKNFSADYCWRAARCELGHSDETIEATIAPGETWQKIIQTNASEKSGSMIGDWHRHHFSGDLKGCEYSSDVLEGGKLRFNIKNKTASTQTVKGGVRVRVVWTPETAANNMPLSKKFIFIAEFAENGMGTKSNPDAFAMIEEAYKKYYERLQKAFQVTSPAETNLYFDYFQHLYGYSTGGEALQFSSAEKARAVMATPEKARGDSAFYKNGSYKFRNRSGGVGYMDNPSNTGEQVYAVIYSLETNFIAMPDIKVAGMAWQATDGTPGGITAHGLRYRKKFPNGDIIQKQDTGHPHEIMKARAFFHLLLGNSHVLWEAGARFSADLANWSTWACGDKTYWQPTGGKIVEWQESILNSPQQKKDSKFGFPNAPQVGEQGAWNGAYLYSLISTTSDRVSKSIQYPVYSYSVAGGPAQTGYAKSNDPVKGKLGAEVSRFGLSNPGQSNIVDLYKSKKPIVMLTEGKDGFAVAIKNIWVKPTDVVTYRIKIGAGEKVITQTGRLLGVYAFR